MSNTRQRAPQSNQLFEDTSQPPASAMYGGATPMQPGYMQPGGNFSGPNFLNDPVVTNMAMQYGQTLAGQGKEILEKNVSILWCI